MTTHETSERPLSLAFCITELEVGGAERCLAELATRLPNERFRKVVYSLAPWPRPGRDSLAASLLAAGVEVECLGVRSAAQFPLAVARLAGKLRRTKPAILQTFLFHANIVGRIAARLAGVPHAVSGIRVAERRQNWHLAIDRWTRSLVDRHVCVSEDVARFARDVGGLPAARLLVIPNGVDVERHRLAEPVDLSTLGLPANRRAMTYIGRLDPQKRIDWLLDLAPEIFAPVGDCDLVIVGEGPERPRLEKQARESQYSHRVHFVGWRSDVPAILKASELVVLPSAWEGMPNVVLEAMASGRPVVTTAVEGVRELLGPAGDQQISPVDSPDLFAELAVTILQDSRLAHNLGEQNMARADDRFSLTAMVAEYEKLYRSLQET